MPQELLSFLRQWNRPGCYGWFRDGVCLYVGASVRLAHRLITHTVVQPVDGDSVRLWPTKTWEAAEALEKKLTTALRPLQWLRGPYKGGDDYYYMERVPLELRELARSLRRQGHV